MSSAAPLDPAREPAAHARPPNGAGGPGDALAQTLAQWRATLASTTDAILVTDAAGNVTDYNDNLLRLWRIPAELMATRDRDRLREIVTRQLSEPGPFLGRIREIEATGPAETFDVIELADGRVFERHSRVQRDGDRHLGRVWCFRDITARRQIATELRDREQRLNAIIRQAAVGIAVARDDGRFEETNAKFAEVMGYTEEELRQLTVLDLTHPDDRAETRRRMQQVLTGEVGEYQFEKRYVRKDGAVVWSLTSVALLRDARGRPDRFVGIVEDITARKRAEDALQRREEELRAMADSIPQLVWMADPDGHIFWYNRRWFDYTGTTLEQMQGWGWQSVHDPALLPAVVERWRHSLATGEAFEMEFPLRGADGVFRWFLTRVNPLRDADGKIVRWFGTNTDVDYVRRTEQALREETRVLELLNRTGTAIAAQLDIQVLLQTVTDAATELSGAKFGAFFYNSINAEGEALVLYTLSGAPREAFEKFGHPRATPLFGPTFRGAGPVRIADVRQDPRYGQMPPHHGMPKGHLPVRSYLAVPVISRSGEVFGGLFFGHPEPDVFTARTERLVVAVAAQAAVAIDNARLYDAAQREIAARSRTEQQLRESETRARVSLETAALGTWQLEPAKGDVLLDARCQELFGVPGRPSVALEEFFALADPAHAGRRQREIQRLIAGEIDRYRLEFRVRDRDRWVTASAKPVHDEQGRLVRIIGAVEDVTDIVKARASLEERQKELEILVDQRTELLQRAVAQMEEFSYSVSHDLRAPLRSIQSYAEIIKEDFAAALPAEALGYLDRIRSAGERMDRLTRDVLAYSKVARADAPLAPVDLDRVVRETVEQYTPANVQPSAVAIAHPLAPVVGHEPLLVQAISNLLANAFKFVRPGVPPRVEVRTEKRGGRVRLWISDNGIGVPAEFRDRIWGMFERAHADGRYEGTGIGLAIVRKAVERMHGEIGVESDGVAGSRFWIELPGVG